MMITTADRMTAARLRVRGFTAETSPALGGTLVTLGADTAAHVMVVPTGYHGHVLDHGARRLFTGMSLPRLVEFLNRF